MLVHVSDQTCLFWLHLTCSCVLQSSPTLCTPLAPIIWIVVNEFNTNCLLISTSKCNMTSHTGCRGPLPRPIPPPILPHPTLFHPAPANVMSPRSTLPHPTPLHPMFAPSDPTLPHITSLYPTPPDSTPHFPTHRCVSLTITDLLLPAVTSI